MKLYTHPDKANWPAILQRPVMEVERLDATVQAVLDEVRAFPEILSAKPLVFDVG